MRADHRLEGWWRAADGEWYPPHRSPGEGWWRASDGRWYPPDSSPGPDWQRGPDGVWHPQEGVTAATIRRRRVWRASLGSIGVILVAVVALATLARFDETVLTHDLLDADFESGAAPFVVAENDEYVVAVIDGTYRMSAKSDNPSTPAISHAWFARTAWTVHAAATIVDEPDQRGTVGIGCIGASAGGALDSGFTFLVGDGRGALVDLSDGDVVDQPMVVRAGQRIGIECGSEMATIDGKVRATVDGEVVLTGSNGNSDGFERLVLVFFPAHADDSVSFDDVIAEVP